VSLLLVAAEVDLLTLEKIELVDQVEE